MQRGKRTKYPGVRALGDDRYELRLKACCPKTGRQRDTTLTVIAQSPAEAAAKRLAALHAPAKAPRDPERLLDFGASWLKAVKGSVTLGTLRNYTFTVGALCDHLGDYYTDRVTVADLQGWRDGELGRGVRPSTINMRIAVLRALFAWGVEEGHLAENPARRLRLLSEGERRCKALTPQQATQLLSVFRQHAPHYYPLTLFLAHTGARFGEGAALQWADVDWDQGEVRINRGVYRGVLGPPKTKRTRLVALSEQLAAVWRAEQQRQLRAQHPALAAGWIHPTDEGNPCCYQAYAYAFQQLVRKHGPRPDCTAHWLRWTWNNLARQAADAVVVRAMTGHSTVGMTEHYSHVGREEKRAVVLQVAARLGG